MNSQDAKKILEMYRPGGADVSDPRFAEALEQLLHDHTLAQWFEEQKSFDRAAAHGVKSIRVPGDLKASLLAGRKVIRLPLWRDSRARAAAAASILILAVASGAVFGSGPMRFPELREQLVEQAWATDAHLDLESNDWQEVRKWLGDHAGEADLALPPALAGLTLLGGRLVEVKGRKVPFVCLADGLKHLHLFVMDDQNLRDLPSPGIPDFEKCGAWKTASWQQGGRTYVLTGMNYQTFVSRFRKAGRWTMSG